MVDFRMPAGFSAGIALKIGQTLVADATQEIFNMLYQNSGWLIGLERGAVFEFFYRLRQLADPVLRETDDELAFAV